MLKDKLVKKAFYWSLTTILIGTVVFAGLIPVNNYLIYGWLFGSVAATVGYLINVRLISIFLKSVRTKTKGIVLGSLRSLLQMVYHSGVLIILIAVNTYWKSSQVFEMNSIDDLINPLNIFTYLGALGIYPICALVVQLPWFSKESEVSNG